jgi:hypothetical protein
MLGVILIAVGGIFAIGVVVGVIVAVSHGIHREEQHFQEERRFQEEQGLWGVPGVPDHFLTEAAPDGVSWAARRLNGLFVRHLPPVSNDAELGLRV